MSGGDDFLARWSRRKREVEEAEKPGEDVSALGEPPPPSGCNLESGRGRAGEGGPPEQQNPLPSPTPDPSQQGGGEEPVLPRLEDLTAESDVTAFMKQGVPEALKRAALRRAWSLDPAIRDYVGPAEYAWDFTDPASIPGFGAAPGLDVSGAADYARKIVSFSSGAAESAAESAKADSSVAVASDAGGSTPAIAEPSATAPAEDAQPAPSATHLPNAPPAPQAKAANPDLPAGAGRRHGGALPR